MSTSKPVSHPAAWSARAVVGHGGGPPSELAVTTGASAVPPPAPEPDAYALIASPAHTARFVAILLGMAALLALGASRTPATPQRNHVPQYLFLLFFEWTLFYFAWIGLKKRGTSVASIIGGPWRSAKDVLVTIGLSVGFLLAAQVVLEGLKRGLASIGQSPAAEGAHTTALMAPHGVVEIVLWIVLSASAGICEEFVFRGYLQRQLGAMTRRPWAGLLLSALIFGLGHAYQGWRSVVVITIYGALFGMLALFSRSLRPGMLAHALQDVVGGLRG